MKKIKDTLKDWKDAEACVLACFLIDNEAFDYARKKYQLEPDDFKERLNRKIFEAMIHIHYCESQSIDLLTLHAEHKRRNLAIDLNYISHLVTLIPTSAYLDTYIVEMRNRKGVK